jgi:hypothetical protein
MADIYTIDATGGKFTQKRFNEFCSYIKTENELVHIVVDDIDECVPYNQLRALLETKELAEIFESKPNDICSFACEDAALIVDTNDVTWWQKQKDGKFVRTEKLFSEVQINIASQPKEKKEKTTSSVTSRSRALKIAAGVQEGADINELELFEGDNKSCVAFINEYFAKMNIRSRFDENKTVKFVVDYHDDEELCISTNWKTIDELELEGVVQIV